MMTNLPVRWLAIVTLAGMCGCFLDAEPLEPPEPRLALYSVPSSLSREDRLLTLVGAKLYPGDDDDSAFCLRLTAEQGLLALPGSSRAASAPAADGGGSDGGQSCALPGCLDVPFVREGPVRVAYLIYEAARGAPNDILVGVAYENADCSSRARVVPAARATMLLYPAAQVPDAAAPDAGVADVPDATDTPPEAPADAGVADVSVDVADLGVQS